MPPQGFDFPDRDTWSQPEDLKLIGGYITTSFHLSDCIRGVIDTNAVTIKAPPKKGTFTVLYRLNCEGFTSGYEEIKFVVE